MSPKFRGTIIHVLTRLHQFVISSFQFERIEISWHTFSVSRYICGVWMCISIRASPIDRINLFSFLNVTPILAPFV